MNGLKGIHHVTAITSSADDKNGTVFLVMSCYFQTITNHHST